jgi:hypothetical protein
MTLWVSRVVPSQSGLFAVVYFPPNFCPLRSRWLWFFFGRKEQVNAAATGEGREG